MVQQVCAAFVNATPIRVNRWKSSRMQACHAFRLLPFGVVVKSRRNSIIASANAPEGASSDDTKQQASKTSEDEEQEEPEPSYWQGEYICADCGFVYNNAKRKRKFEDLPDTWVCPQCQAPKRRFARKVGDFVEQTAGTSNTPIIIFSVVGLLLTVLFGFWANKNL